MVATTFNPDGTTVFERNNIVFQQDETCLDEEFPYWWIGIRGETEWLARSPDFNPWDFFIWGLLKSVVSTTVPASIQDLINRSQEGTLSHYNYVSYFLGTWSHPTPRVKFWKFYSWAKVGASWDFGETLVRKIHRHKSPKMIFNDNKFNGGKLLFSHLFTCLGRHFDRGGKISNISTSGSFLSNLDHHNVVSNYSGSPTFWELPSPPVQILKFHNWAKVATVTKIHRHKTHQNIWQKVKGEPFAFQPLCTANPLL